MVKGGTSLHPLDITIIMVHVHAGYAIINMASSTGHSSQVDWPSVQLVAQFFVATPLNCTENGQ